MGMKVDLGVWVGELRQGSLSLTPEWDRTNGLIVNINGDENLRNLQLAINAYFSGESLESQEMRSDEHRYSDADIHVLLKQAGFKSQWNGYDFIFEALRLLRTDKTLLRNMGEYLHVPIAEKLRLNRPQTVEGGIRRSIERAWKTGLLEERFNQKWPSRPTNGDFLSSARNILVCPTVTKE